MIINTVPIFILWYTIAMYIRKCRSYQRHINTVLRYTNIHKSVWNECGVVTYLDNILFPAIYEGRSRPSRFRISRVRLRPRLSVP